MPSFSFLETEEIDAVVRYVEKLSGIDSTVSRESIPTGPPLDDSPALRNTGKEVYGALGCVSCHGNLGRGDGTSALNLTDVWGYPTTPQDFTSGQYIGGNRPEDLYFRFVSGMDGTPMPSYHGMIEEMGETPEERSEKLWGLIHYVKSLETFVEKAGRAAEDGIITATQGRQAVNSLAFNDGGWDGATAYSIPLSRLWQKGHQNVLDLTVRIRSGGDKLMIRLDWEDLSADKHSYRSEDFRDAAAVQFSTDGTASFHGMGSNDHPALIWFWRPAIGAANQFVDDMDAAPASRIERVQNEAQFFPALLVGNKMIEPRTEEELEVLMASGPETAATQIRAEKVTAEGWWHDGRWTAIFAGKIPAESCADDGLLPIAFAVWDGASRDRDGQKMVSTWYRVWMEE